MHPWATQPTQPTTKLVQIAYHKSLEEICRKSVDRISCTIPRTSDPSTRECKMSFIHEIRAEALLPPWKCPAMESWALSADGRLGTHRGYV